MVDCDITHIVKMEGHTVRCYEHTDESITALVKRYYEGKYGKNCEVVNAAGSVIYTTPESGAKNENVC